MTARQLIHDYLTGRAACMRPRTDTAADTLLNAYHAQVRDEVLREAADELDAHCEQHGVFGVGDRLRRKANEAAA
ncbi:hypothetical protein RM780_04230 [Streptomyces sp. DSM 44917]|uniref:Uncharacterized protein n=1 Tax=Streptomyces boetiae TaxID=3075541 RepID=A0ABU2L3M9_9ACTN|nr:hypothetical protein [Streptomyces sp. DSM 44917]MDT0306170.1 hypothetical protein [Streptomyces sp. DSM 44917]